MFLYAQNQLWFKKIWILLVMDFSYVAEMTPAFQERK